MSPNSPQPEQDWTVVKAVESLRAGDRFIFAEKFGGEGEVVTATGPANNFMGTRTLGTEELDFDLEFEGNPMVQIVTEEKS